MGLEKPVISGTIGGNKVKHIQRGTFDSDFTNNEYAVSLSGFTNANKMLAILNGGSFTSGLAPDLFVKSLTVDKLIIGCDSGMSGCYGSYQVIEFD